MSNIKKLVCQYCEKEVKNQTNLHRHLKQNKQCIIIQKLLQENKEMKQKLLKYKEYETKYVLIENVEEYKTQIVRLTSKNEMLYERCSEYKSIIISTLRNYTRQPYNIDNTPIRQYIFTNNDIDNIVTTKLTLDILKQGLDGIVTFTIDNLLKNDNDEIMVKFVNKTEGFIKYKNMNEEVVLDREYKLLGYILSKIKIQVEIIINNEDGIKWSSDHNNLFIYTDIISMTNSVFSKKLSNKF
jgi:hypothetical protein